MERRITEAITAPLGAEEAEENVRGELGAALDDVAGRLELDEIASLRSSSSPSASSSCAAEASCARMRRCLDYLDEALEDLAPSREELDLRPTRANVRRCLVFVEELRST